MDRIARARFKPTLSKIRHLTSDHTTNHLLEIFSIKAMKKSSVKALRLIIT
jgi:hypothetical protein